jgi:hypothetical protein
MPEKILYFLGAGASAKALPLARSVWGEKGTEEPPVVLGLAWELQHFKFGRQLKPLSPDETIDTFSTAFEELSKKADEFGDVDTYAKYLNLMGRSDEFQGLKRTLSQFFALKQAVVKERDPRYLPWLVSIMSTKTFPNDVKILSWNYDFQVELAAAQMGDLDDVGHNAGNSVYAQSILKYYPNLDPNPSNGDYADLSLIHLNGVAGFTKGNEFEKASVFQYRYATDENKAVEFIRTNKLESLLHFAWENRGYHSEMMKHVVNMIKQTSILVVIGYSFPFFNREYDKQIFKQLTREGLLRKIYYQDPVLTGEQLRAQFGLSKGIEIVHIKSTDNFHVPFEY